jgi:hypothetical protein
LSWRGIAYNGYVFETFGISKHFPVKLQVLLIRAEMLDNQLTVKCFIPRVIGRFYFLNNLLFSESLKIMNFSISMSDGILSLTMGRMNWQFIELANSTKIVLN